MNSTFSVPRLAFTVLAIVPLLAANGATAAAPQIIPSMSFQQGAVNLDQTNIFVVSVSGDSPLTFQWRLDGADLPGQTNRSLVTYPAQPADEGDYSVVITNAFGAVTSSPARLWVVPRQTDLIKDNFTNAGLRLPYFYLLPGGYDPARRYPLIYWLHGTPGDETVITNANYGYPGYGSYAALKVPASFRQQQTDPVILVWPARRAGDAYGDWTTYYSLLPGLLDHLLLQFSIDTNRVYVEGASGGFHAAWDLLGMRRGFFAASRMCAGWQGTTSPASIENVPTWIWCAANDDFGQLANTQQAVRALRLAGGNPVYTEYQLGKHMGGIFIGYSTPVMLEWMLAQRRGVAPTNEPLLAITGPTSEPVLPTGAAGVRLAGSAAALGQPVTLVTWTNYANTANGIANGTDTWSANASPLVANRTNLIDVVGATTSWAPAYGGNTTFNDALRVACYPVRATLAGEGPNAILNWTGGRPPYCVQWTTVLAAGNWTNLLPNVTPPVTLPLDAPLGFYRIVGQ